ncbi:hypothetical protein Q0Z83_028310 [Actinoplanes sichuanensis]|nr:hypothetical protein Q0Z83_028310 [Actinoplanes sichuanensis]
MLFAVLTCVPSDTAQRELTAELHRLLAPGGVLYVSDLMLQTDDHHKDRYHRSPAGTPYGVFTTTDGAVCRHHDREHLRGLLADFDLTAERRLEVPTMNGSRATAVQLLAHRR